MGGVATIKMSESRREASHSLAGAPEKAEEQDSTQGGKETSQSQAHLGTRQGTLSNCNEKLIKALQVTRGVIQGERIDSVGRLQYYSTNRK